MPAAFDAYFEAMDETLLSLMGEECTFYPKDGSERTVTGAVEESAEVIEGPRTLNTAEELNVLVMRDKDNATYGGIDAPVLGDRITREGSDDEYSFDGVKREVSSTAWVLRFARTAPHEIGGNRLR